MSFKDTLVKDLASKIKAEIKPEGEVSVAPENMPNAVRPVDFSVQPSVKQLKSDKQVAEVMDRIYLAKQMRGVLGMRLTDADKYSIDSHFMATKAAGMTADIADTIQDGFTEAFIEDAYKMTVASQLFGIERKKAGLKETVKEGGIKAYKRAEGGDATTSQLAYGVHKYESEDMMVASEYTYESIEESFIDIAGDIRANSMRAYAEGVDRALFNGDRQGTMDVGRAYNTALDAETLFNGLRYYAIGTHSVDFTGSALTLADFDKKVIEMRSAMGIYGSQNENRNLRLVVTDAVMWVLQQLSVNTTSSQSGLVSTIVDGRMMTSYRGIPIVVSQFMEQEVSADGTYQAAGNTFGSMLLINTRFYKLYYTNDAIAEFDRNIRNKTLLWTTSQYLGGHNVFGQTPTNINGVDTVRKTIVAGVNIVI